MSRSILLPLFVLLPAALFAESAMPGIRFTGAPSDGGQNCSVCHNSFGAANSDSTGSLAVNITDYNPGVTQTIKIMVQHPKASRFGFQITIRQVTGGEIQEAGTFTPVVASDPVQVRCDDGSHFGSAAPCNGLPEFAEHMDAPRITTPGAGFEFDVLWTPPANEVGNLRVYVTVVAADGDGTAAGDRVYTLARTLPFVGACPFTKKPTLQTALNGASFQPSFSSSAMISIFGLGFQTSGRTRNVGSGDIVNNSFPTVLGCVSVQMSGPGIPAPGVLLPIAYIQQDQINAQAPVFTGTGPVSITVILNPGKPNEFKSDIGTLNTQQPFAPAFFVFGTSTSIAGQIGGTSTPVANPSIVAGGRPAKPGEIVTLYGTGFGATNPSVPTGQIAAGAGPLTNPITVTIGGVTLAPTDVLYAGLSPQSIGGLYQFNLRVPMSTPDGDTPVVISIGGFQTQAGVTIPVLH